MWGGGAERMDGARTSMGDREDSLGGLQYHPFRFAKKSSPLSRSITLASRFPAGSGRCKTIVL